MSPMRRNCARTAKGHFYWTSTHFTVTVNCQPDCAGWPDKTLETVLWYSGLCVAAKKRHHTTAPTRPLARPDILAASPSIGALAQLLPSPPPFRLAIGMHCSELPAPCHHSKLSATLGLLFIIALLYIESDCAASNFKLFALIARFHDLSSSLQPLAGYFGAIDGG